MPILIYNKIIPFPGYKILNLFGLLFVRGTKGKTRITDVDINHERIHTKQMQEMLYVFFYLAYFFEWLFRMITGKYNKSPYRSLSFEQEAFDNQKDLDYLKKRKHFAEWRKNYGQETSEEG